MEEGLNPTQRFSDRVENYAKYRPSYPKQIIDFMKSELAVAYEALIDEFGTDYEQVKNKNVDEYRIENFLGKQSLNSSSHGTLNVQRFYNYQEFDFEGLLGRLTSSSYIPNVEHPRYQEMCLALKNLFNQYNVNGLVRIDYDTQVYFSQLSS